MKTTLQKRFKSRDGARYPAIFERDFIYKILFIVSYLLFEGWYREQSGDNYSQHHSRTNKHPETHLMNSNLKKKQKDLINKRKQKTFFTFVPQPYPRTYPMAIYSLTTHSSLI